MNNYIKVEIPVNDPQLRDELIAVLSLMDFEGFEETDDQVLAYQDESKFSEPEVQAMVGQFGLGYTTSLVPQQNWNALWESNFDPVVVDDFCAIRADFHEPIAGVKHEILITPKMSFGTGHHATTYLMIQQMRDLTFANAAVADFGTGTGVLAILAEKLGASTVTAIDYDEWSIENTRENIQKNGCQSIILEKEDHFKSGKDYDIILANINKNVIVDNLRALAASLKPTGKLLLSGLLKADENEVISACNAQNLRWLGTHERNNWITILLAVGL